MPHTLWISQYSQDAFCPSLGRDAAVVGPIYITKRVTIIVMNCDKLRTNMPQTGKEIDGEEDDYEAIAKHSSSRVPNCW